MTEQKLIIESLNQNPPMELVTLTGGINIIGRNADCEVCIDEGAVSREHCSIYKADDYWIFTDLGSTNGSWVNNERIEDGRLVLLRNGDTVQLSGVPLRVKIQNPVVTQGGMKLLLFHGREHINTVTTGSLAIGRDSAEFPIAREGHEDSSAIFTFDGDAVSVTVTPSKKGVLLNTKRTIGRHALTDRDVVSVGEYSVVVVDTSCMGELKPLALKPQQVSSQISSEGTPQPAYVFGAAELSDENTLSTTGSFNRERLEARYKRRGVTDNGMSGQQLILVYSLSFLVICALIFGIAYVSLSS